MTRRCLLVLPLVVCFCASCQTPEERGVRMVLAHGGEVTRDETLPDRPVVAVKFKFGCDMHLPDVGFNWPLAILARIAWDIEFSGIRGLAALRSLDMEGSPVTDGNLNAIKDLEHLQHLNLFLKEDITDAGFKHIGAIKSLVSLELGVTRITDAGLEHLKGLKKLEDLGLMSTHVTDAGVIDLLKELKSLRRLNLGSTQITDDCLKQVKELKDLECLRLDSTYVTDAGLKDIGELKGLQELILSSRRITDAGIRHLKELKGLKKLSLSDTGITDDGLQDLKELKALEELHLRDTEITLEGLMDIEKALPKTRISYYDYRKRRSLPPNRPGPPPPALPPAEQAAVDFVLAHGGTVQRDEYLPGRPVVAVMLIGSRPPVTDADLKQLAVLKDLRELNLGLNPSVDAGFIDLLKEQKYLRIVELGGTKVTQATWAALKELKDLESLGLSSTGITDADMAQIAELRGLRILSIGSTKVTDMGVRELKRLNGLRVLDLNDTRVTDACLGDLKELGGLTSIRLVGTAVTPRGVEDLRKAMPRTNIVF